MPAASLSQGRTTPSFGASILLSVAVLLVRPAVAQDGRSPESQKSKAMADKAADIEASRFCANAAPSIAEARIAWEDRKSVV